MRVPLGVVVWLLAALVTAWPGPAAAQQPREITIASSSSSLGAAGSRIANEMGLFAKHGLAPRFSILDNSSNALAALMSGSVQFAVAGTPELIVSHARGQTQPVAIATSAGSLAASLVLARSVVDKLGVASDAPVADRLKALNGLVIGTPSAVAIGTVTFRRAAQAAGATIRWTYLDQPSMPAALASGAIQGFQSSSPYWVFPVIRNEGVLWLSGPKGEIPAEFAPAVTSPMQTLRSFAAANLGLVSDVAAVFDDLAKAVEQRPADVKAAIGRIYPSLDAKVIDVLFDSESRLWTTPRATPQVMAREIALLKASGIPLPPTDGIDPASMLFP